MLLAGIIGTIAGRDLREMLAVHTDIDKVMRDASIQFAVLLGKIAQGGNRPNFAQVECDGL